MNFTIPSFLESTLQIYGKKEGVFAGSESLTFGALHEEALGSAHVLKDMGVEKGDRVGVCMTKSINQVITIMGILYANAVFVPILPKLREPNIRHIIEDSGAKVLITDHDRVKEVVSYQDKVSIVIGDNKFDSAYPCMKYLNRHITNRVNFFNCIGNDNAAILYSSGSTGRPKGIVISHRNLGDGARIVSGYLGTTSDDRIAGILSLNFDYGLNQLWQTIYKGASIYLHELIFPNDLFRLLSNKGITALPVMPVILTNMFDPRFYSADEVHDYSALRYICSSGGPVSQRMIQQMSDTFPTSDIYQMYGLTESFRSTFLPPGQIKQRPTSIGKAIPDVEVLVLDDHGNVCGPGVTGELVHRGGCIAKGYWNDPKKTEQVFRTLTRFPGETVVFSGDAVRSDDEGYLYFVSRKDSMIKTHGYRVSPTEIEEEVGKHQKVQQSVAYGIPNIEIGQEIVLAYTTSDGEPIDHNMLLQFVKKYLPSYMVPTHLIHLEEMPSTGNEGKVDRLLVVETTNAKLGLAF